MSIRSPAHGRTAHQWIWSSSTTCPRMICWMRPDGACPGSWTARPATAPARPCGRARCCFPLPRARRRRTRTTRRRSDGRPRCRRSAKQAGTRPTGRPPGRPRPHRLWTALPASRPFTRMKRSSSRSRTSNCCLTCTRWNPAEPRTRPRSSTATSCSTRAIGRRSIAAASSRWRCLRANTRHWRR